MIVYANAKINLSLDVAGKREDGYHDVSMIMQEVDLCDKLVIDQSEGEGIELWCDKLMCDADNIAYKAAWIYYQKTGIVRKCSMKLYKNIPVCAGLGGGSSDAAAVLKALNELNGYVLTNDELKELGLKLGADVPFFIEGGTALAEGIGERLTALKSPPVSYVVLIKPDIDISTALAYKEIDSGNTYHPDTKAACECLQNGNAEQMYKYCGNSFEEVTRGKYPQIEMIKTHLYNAGAVFSMMSGSGPTVFGIFDERRKAEDAFASYSGSFQGGGVAKFV